MGDRDTSDAERITRYLCLCDVLPDDVVAAANGYASTKLARYKRDALLEVLAPFRTPQEGRDTASPLLFGTLLCRALRYQEEHVRPGNPSPAATDPRAEARPVLELMKMGAGPAFVYWFMDSPALNSYFSSTDSHEFVEERAWVKDLGPPPSIWSYAGHYDEDPGFAGL
ncbi:MULTISPECIES: hypothetical protein [unclassified Microbacterium]|uniref:hypothetical protein n=1 Tax=unclassified Microbacterium TaxID=2609290 RepID=UPI0030103EF6